MHFILYYLLCSQVSTVSRNPKALALLPPPADSRRARPNQDHLFLRQSMMFTGTHLLLSRPKTEPLLLMPFSVAAAHTLQVLKCLIRLSVPPCSCGGRRWASGDQMKLGWENLASENCLMR